MRVGIIAPPWLPVPPPAYGGTETVVDNLARGLARRGHDVRLFTVGESTCPVTRRHLFPRGAAPMGDGLSEAAHVLAAYEDLADVDIIHDHTTLGALIAAGTVASSRPVVTTNHGPFNAEARRVLGRASRTARVIAISRSQARAAGCVPIAAVIHHGVDLDLYQFGPGGGGYLLFIGRMSPDKGVHRAVRIAHRAARPIKIAAKMRTPAERAYYERFVAPLLADDDEVFLEAPIEQRIELLRHADGLVNPIRWDEPFGLVMIEALASGTPVLASPFGAAPEIVQHGLTGFLCKDESAMVAAITRLPDIDRRRCRTRAETRFGLDRMAADHLRLYERILADRPHRLGRAGGSTIADRLTS